MILACQDIDPGQSAYRGEAGQIADHEDNAHHDYPLAAGTALRAKTSNADAITLVS